MISESQQKKKGHMLGYSPLGLINIRNKYTKLQQIPKYFLIQQSMMLSLSQVAKIKPVTELIYFYNITKLIDVLSQQLNSINALKFQYSQSQISIAKSILTSMSIFILLNCRNHNISQEFNLKSHFQRQINVNRQRLNQISSKIKDKSCPFINEQMDKDKNIILDNRDLFLKQNVYEGIRNQYLQISLGCVFQYVLYKLRKLLRAKEAELKQNKQITSEIKKKIKYVMMLSYYVSASLNIQSIDRIKQMAKSNYSSANQSTYVHLLFNPEGLIYLSKYFKEASSKMFDQDIELVSKILHIKTFLKVRTSIQQ